MKHDKQVEVLKDNSRFKYILAGRRGGKTKLITEHILKTISLAKPGDEVFYIGPTNSQAKELIWEPVENRLYELGWKYRDRQSKSRFEFSDGVKFYVIGAEKIRRIRGHRVKMAYLDELAYFEEDLSFIWNAIRPALTDSKGGAILSTTPNGKGTQAYDFYLETLGKKDWKYFHWKTIDNPFIDKDEIESAKQELDERSFKQEYEASWETFEGLAYYNFNENLHLGNHKKFESDIPIDILFDFNVNPTTLLVAQYLKQNIFIRKEYSLKNSSTEATVKQFCVDFLGVKDKHLFRIFGDASGHARSSPTGYSDYHYVQEALRSEGFSFQLKIPGANPPIVDRLMHANSWLKNYFGISRVNIDADCKDLIRDLGSQELDGRHPSDKNNLGHKADAFSYYIFMLHLVERQSKQTTIIL